MFDGKVHQSFFHTENEIYPVPFIKQAERGKTKYVIIIV